MLASFAVTAAFMVSACGSSASDQDATSASTYSSTPVEATTPDASATPVNTLPPVVDPLERAARILCRGGAENFADEATRRSFNDEKFGPGTFIRQAFQITNIAEFVDDEELFLAADGRCRSKWQPLAQWWYDNHPTTPGALAATIGISANPEPDIGYGPGHEINPAYEDWTYEDCSQMASAMADGYIASDPIDQEALQQCYATAEYYGN